MAAHHDDIPSTTSRPSTTIRAPDPPVTRRAGVGAVIDVYGCHRCARSNASRSDTGWSDSSEVIAGESTKGTGVRVGAKVTVRSLTSSAVDVAGWAGGRRDSPELSAEDRHRPAPGPDVRDAGSPDGTSPGHGAVREPEHPPGGADRARRGGVADQARGPASRRV